jgi:PIN domain nuclease of toxin-antitoxin system
MKFLLDTHTFIWYVTNNARLSSTALEIINNGNNEVLLSIASIWEMAIKHSIGKLNFESPFESFILRQLAVNNFGVLEVKIKHLNVVANLPLHHRDPFDRLIIAQLAARSLAPCVDAGSLLYGGTNASCGK